MIVILQIAYVSQ